MGRTPLVLTLFLVLQVCDGLLTYFAVDALGVGIEGNIILATWMTLVGPVPTLVVAKVVAAGAGALVFKQGLHGVLAGLTGAYALFAILPWLFVYHVWF